MAIEAKDGCCQEAALIAPPETYLPCNKPAIALVEYPSKETARVCAMCLFHATKNRGAKKVSDITPAKKDYAKATPPPKKPKSEPKLKAKPKAKAKEVAVIDAPVDVANVTKSETAVVEPPHPLDAFPDRKIDRTCHIDELPMKIYHSDCCAGFSVSSGDLVTVEQKGLKNYWSKSYNNPRRYAPKDKVAYILGRLAHCAILGDTAFSNQFIIKKFKTFATDKAKAWRDLQLSKGLTIVTQEQYEIALRMADELAQDPLALAVLEGGIPERTYVKKAGGIFIKSRPDAIASADLTIGDYKKSRRETDKDLLFDITKFDYTMKMANIGECVLANMPGGEAKTIFDFTYVLIMQGDEPPYAVTTVKIEPRAPIEINGKATAESKDATNAVRDSIYWAACQNRRSLKRIEQALESEEWLPPNGGGPVSYSYPQWLANKLRDEQERGELPLLDEHLNEIG